MYRLGLVWFWPAQVMTTGRPAAGMPAAAGWCCGRAAAAAVPRTANAVIVITAAPDTASTVTVTLRCARRMAIAGYLSRCGRPAVADPRSRSSGRCAHLVTVDRRPARAHG